MSFQPMINRLRSNKKRYLPFCGALIIGAAAGGILFASAEPEELPNVPVSHKTVAADASKNVSLSMKNTENLRDPFTPEHWRAGEAPAIMTVKSDAALVPPGLTSNASGTPTTVLTPAVLPSDVSVTSTTAIAPAVPPPLLLSGIMRGEGGRLALITDGQRTVLAGPGDAAFGWSVQHIDTECVILRHADGRQQTLLLSSALTSG